MTSAVLLPSHISKEIRALALPWLACLACVVMPAVVNEPRYLGLSILAYFVGAAALGALSVGHEYSDRTLSLLLSLPVRRERLFAAKLGVLTAMLLTLWIVAYRFSLGDAPLAQMPRLVMSVLPVVYGLGLAPLLTMVSRNAIAGTVFAMAIPGIMFVAGELLGTKQYGHGSVMEAFRLAFVWFGTLGFSVIGFVGSWWIFLRLEAIEGRGEHLSLPRWIQFTSSSRVASPAVMRHPMWLLVKKEIRLQQLAIAIGALHALTLIIATWFRPPASDSAAWSLLASATILYAGMISLVIGASASAGERDLRTLEWQLLQPVAASRQWMIKLGVAFAMSFALAVGLPMAILHLAPVAGVSETLTAVQPDRSTIVALLLLTSGSVYVSSLCSSALWALVMSLPAMMAAFAFFQFTPPRIGRPIYVLALPWAMQILPAGIIQRVNYEWTTQILDTVGLLLLAGFVALILRIALANHRTVDRPLRRIAMQVVMLAAFMIGARLVLSIATAVVVAIHQSQLPPQLRRFR